MGLQLVNGVVGPLAYGQDSWGDVQDIEGDMARADVWYPIVCVVIRLDGFTVALRGVVE